MYTTELQKTAKIENLEDPKLLEAFEARVAADEFIEPKIGRASCRERV